ncbi:TPA: hypothetical protein MBM83_000852 [Klebsiella pneumoniae]|uniref:non-oxidative hydroxyarylic acid decarboxylases subunit D n=1 Tax=Klebsiella pneumoniae TaxID=573 RepID=UPI0026776538|nr:non-oxidative hydroxyarylic acid decarboxylases subunit D [Klebsiella pneumoniae]MDO3713905.1 non-oxidative hydroxyarylic acid decarboxylases subunit D [Klebsiella pneumoniae]HBT3976776.1 hypothetical protein [Klebsiella pneumoniae]HCI6040853.1 hypothetical protein [Klebsiella pneumoniae]
MRWLARCARARIPSLPQCQHCLYTWRDTEPLRRTSREHYPEAFRMTQKDIDEAPQVPHVPPLLPEDKR